MTEPVFEAFDIVKLLQTVLVPLLAIGGLGLFMLVIQTRYGSVINRIRVLNAERLELIKKALTKKLLESETTWNRNRLQDIQKQISILVKRGKMLRDSLQFIAVSVLTFITSSLLLLIEQITRIPLSLVTLIIFSIGMIMLFMCCINIIREVRSSYNAVLLDIATNVPDEYSIRL